MNRFSILEDKAKTDGKGKGKENGRLKFTPTPNREPTICILWYIVVYFLLLNPLLPKASGCFSQINI